MPDLECVISDYHTHWDDPCVDRTLFGTTNPGAIAAILHDFVKNHLDSTVEDCLHYASSVGTAVGVRLQTGQSVLIKVHRAETSLEVLQALEKFRAHVVKFGVPVPEPLALAPLGRGYATVESFLFVPSPPNGFDPAVRDCLAGGLARLNQIGVDYPSRQGFRHARQPEPGGIWRTPHNELFDLENTRSGAEWLDRFGQLSLARMPPAESPPIPGHTDWRVEHVRIDAGRIVAIFDWDSIFLDDEARLVGCAAAHYASNWESGYDGPRYPTPDESNAFIAAYERARGFAFTASASQRIGAARLHELAYVARLGHSLGGQHGPGSATDQLAKFGDGYLDV